LLFVACKQSPDKKELWAEVINFFSPDTAYYPVSREFPFPDSLRYQSLDSFFTNQNKAPIINDSTIVFYDNYRVNGQKICCIKDTLEIYVDSLKGKKYMFVIGDYITVMQSNKMPDSNMRIRRNSVSIPLWGIQLNTPYPPEKFKNEYEKLGATHVKINEKFDEVTRQTWDENDSILVETIQFNNSTDRIITSLYKDMNETEVDSMIHYLRNEFPNIKYKEATKIDSDGKPLKLIRMGFKGISISFTQTSATEYSFTITDYYETIKLIINNAGTRYVFRDDIKLY
jgi:hypothetical protein